MFRKYAIALALCLGFIGSNPAFAAVSPAFTNTMTAAEIGAEVARLSKQKVPLTTIIGAATAAGIINGAILTNALLNNVQGATDPTTQAAVVRNLIDALPVSEAGNVIDAAIARGLDPTLVANAAKAARNADGTPKLSAAAVDARVSTAIASGTTTTPATPISFATSSGAGAGGGGGDASQF